MRADFRRASWRGFTLMELLVVIGIIALLAAILFPTFSIVRGKMRQNQCSSNMKELIQALKMYHDDHDNLYPDGLYGVSYGGALEKRLAGSYVKNEDFFTCPSAFAGCAGNNSLVVPTNRCAGTPAHDRYGRPTAFPVRDSYAMQYRPNAAGGVPEAHYQTKWTPATVTGLADDRRQLYFKETDPSTIATWCLYHADMDASGNIKGGMAVVAFMSGRVETIPAEQFANWPGGGGIYPWQVRPKP